jgi:transcriptional regulator with XRE-family HTH domain
VPRKIPLPRRELEICARVKSVRRDLGYPRRLFANLAGLDSSAVVRIELGRTPLRYEVAKKICDAHFINSTWLATGKDLIRINQHIPPPDELGVKFDALLSEVFDTILWPKLQDEITAPLPGLPKGPETFDEHVKELAHSIACMFLAVNRTDEEISAALIEALKNPLPVPAVTIEAARIIAENLHHNILKRSGKDHSHFHFTNLSSLLAPGKLLHAHYQYVLQHAAEDQEKKDLTGSSLKSKSIGVKSEIQRLIEQVKRKTSKPGAKAALARALGVAPARISEWLSGEKEPGGEYTLKLLHWVRSPERQK